MGCCYRTNPEGPSDGCGTRDCDSPRDWCSKSAGRCSDCNGTFCPLSSESAVDAAVVLAGTDDTGPGKCCYHKGCAGHDCDSPHDYCSKSAGNCGECMGSFCPLSSESAIDAAVVLVGTDEKKKKDVTAHEKQQNVTGPGKCCYYKGCAGHDCDSPRDYCSKSAGNCGECKGSFCPLSSESAIDAAVVLVGTDEKKK